MNPKATIFAGYKNYKEYLNSYLWIDKKEWIFHLEEIKDAYGKRTGLFNCEICKRNLPKKMMTLHHLNYNCIGSERREDLLVICNNCHKKIHKKQQ